MQTAQITEARKEVLDTVILAVSNPELRQLARQVARQSGMDALYAESQAELLRLVREGGYRLAIVELSMLTSPVRSLCEVVERQCGPVRAIFIAHSAQEAQKAGVEIGGCVHHLFTYFPSSDYLQAFLASAREKLRESS